MEKSGRILLGIIEFKEAKRLRSLLEERGVSLELVSNPSTCSTGGCALTVEAYVLEPDVPQVRELLQEERIRMHDGLEYDPSLSDEVYDPSKPTARCPACATEFSTEQKACPECGLVFSS